MNNSELYNIFLNEASEIVDSLESGLLVLEKDADNDEIINEVFRAAHTLKGSSGMVDFNELSEFVHEVEDVLSRIRNGSVKISKKLITVFLQSVDLIKLLVKKGPGGADTDLQNAVTANRNELRKYRQSVSRESKKVDRYRQKSDSGREKFIQIDLKFRPDIFLTGTDPLMLIREILDHGEIIRTRCYIDALPEIDEMRCDKFYLSWSMIVRTTESMDEIEGIFIFVRDENPIRINDISSHFVDGVDKRYADKKLGEILDEEGLLRQKDFEAAVEREKKRSGEILVEQKKVDEKALGGVLDRQKQSKRIVSESTIRVGTGKLDKLVNLVGEMVNGISRISQQLENVRFSRHREINDTVEMLERMSKDVQEQVMRVRMIPLEGTFKKFHRLVRDAGNQLDKKIELHIEGSENELDKTVIEKLSDPLNHLIRNAADHGIETPEERLERNKPVDGAIWLRAYQEEGKVIIEIEDDGHGINREQVLKKAMEKGLYNGDDVTENDVYDFLMMAGFSTASEVSEISGRGVGLDVVKQNIEKLRGNMEIVSEEGVGTMFRIKLPLTLAIIDGMKVRVGREVLIVPLLSIIEAVLPRRSMIKTIEGKGELVESRGEFIPLIRLYEVFNLPTDRTDPEDAVLMILEGHNRQFAIMVDDVVGQQQAVIKSLTDNYRQVIGISGATILGSGRVSLIVDVHGLERTALNAQA